MVETGCRKTSPCPAPLPLFWFSCCLVFLFFVLLLSAQTGAMIVDADPFWHIATGDWIRAHGQVPATDPFSFTAGDYPWLNLSWGWDCAFSYVREHLGWHGVLAINALIIAFTFTLLFAACFVASGNGWASFLTVIAASLMCTPNVRPLQITQLLLAVWMLLLGGVARGIFRRYWLCLLPLTALLWANVHGGFLAGFTVLGAYLVQAAWCKDGKQTRSFFYVAASAFCALFISPYGNGFVTAVIEPLNGISRYHISEWSPFVTSTLNLLMNFYAVLFIALVRQKPAGAEPAEFWLSWAWLLAGITCCRHLPVFAVISAPVFACRLQMMLTQGRPTALYTTVSSLFSRKLSLIMVSGLCLGICFWLPSSAAMHAFGDEHAGHPVLTQEIAFLKEHYPHLRVLNDGFILGGRLIYESGGTIPVFIDGRTETAYPLQVVKDYYAFDEASPGWESILDKYDIGGMLLLNTMAPVSRDRFVNRKGWVKVFDGPFAVLYVRENHAKP